MPQNNLQERNALPMQTRRAPVSAINAEARTVDLVWTTGASVRRRRWDWVRDRAVEYDEILLVTPDAVNMERMSAGAPVLDSHGKWNTESQLAVVDRAWLEGGEGKATIRFPAAGIDAASDRMFGMVADKIIRNVSVGYSVDRVRKEPPAREGEPEKWFIERWTPMEISFVSIPADPGAQVRSENTERSFPVEFIDRGNPETMENIMYDVKSIFASRTIWGGIIALVASAAAIWGYSISPADQAQIVELITGIGGIIGSVLAIYGRIVATTKIA